MVDEIIFTVNSLYRCVFKGCEEDLTEITLGPHLQQHGRPSSRFRYKCRHCTFSYNSIPELVQHVRGHSGHRFFCYICFESAATFAILSKHFREKHNWNKSLALNTLKDMMNTSSTEVIFFVCNKKKINEHELVEFGMKLVEHWERKKAAKKTRFYPEEINLLPTTPIFNSPLACSICEYTTKVRTNIIRHLQMHKSGAADGRLITKDPINPMPCLNTTERHSDKMLNLSSASVLKKISAEEPKNGKRKSSAGTQQNKKDLVQEALRESQNYSVFSLKYAFVEPKKRYTCGVEGCYSLTVTENLFRSHLNALHSDAMNYCCPFCSEEICTAMSIDKIIQHIRYHDAKVYQCMHCHYLHYMKKVVERHMSERHTDIPKSDHSITAYERSVDGDLEGLTTVYIGGDKYNFN